MDPTQVTLSTKCCSFKAMERAHRKPAPSFLLAQARSAPEQKPRATCWHRHSSRVLPAVALPRQSLHLPVAALMRGLNQKWSPAHGGPSLESTKRPSHAHDHALDMCSAYAATELRKGWPGARREGRESAGCAVQFQRCKPEATCSVSFGSR